MEDKRLNLRSIILKVIPIIVFISIIVFVSNSCNDKVRKENKELEKQITSLEKEITSLEKEVSSLEKQVEKKEKKLEKIKEKEYYVCINSCTGDKERYDSGKIMPFWQGFVVSIVKETDDYYQLANYNRDDFFLEKDLFDKNFKKERIF